MIQNELIALNGAASVLGRAVIIHAQRDDGICMLILLVITNQLQHNQQEMQEGELHNV
jgi:hypothetical protein